MVVVFAADMRDFLDSSDSEPACDRRHDGRPGASEKEQSANPRRVAATASKTKLKQPSAAEREEGRQAHKMAKRDLWPYAACRLRSRSARRVEPAASSAPTPADPTAPCKVEVKEEGVFAPPGLSPCKVEVKEEGASPRGSGSADVWGADWDVENQGYYLCKTNVMFGFFNMGSEMNPLRLDDYGNNLYTSNLHVLAVSECAQTLVELIENTGKYKAFRAGDTDLVIFVHIQYYHEVDCVRTRKINDSRYVRDLEN